MLWFLLGLVCLLLVIGFFVTGGSASVQFAMRGLVVLGAAAFVIVVLVVLYALVFSR